ncbi:MAG: ATP-binding protein [Actinomycetales bacterium]|nr:ATP-binding protein [Actinomycetales bacterium]
MTHAAQLRTARILAAVIGAAGLLYAVLSWGALQEQAGAAPPAWTVVAALGAFGVPVLVGALGWVLPLPALRVGLAGSGILSLALIASAAVLVRGLPPESPPWIVTFLAIGPAALAAAVPRGWIGVSVPIAVAELVVVRLAAGGRAALSPAIEDAIFSIAICSIFVALAVVVGRQAEQLDAQAAAAERRSGDRAAAEARLTERDRVDALLHDTVLSALLLAARGTPAVEQEVRRQAGEALGALDAAVDPAQEPGAVATTELAEVLRARLVRVAGRVPVREVEGAASVSGASHPADGAGVGARPAPGETRIPAAIAEALIAAVLEAVRNAGRHAGPRAHQSVEVAAHGDGVRIEIRDDGRGFDPETVDPARLGVRRSILGRVRALPGGRAEIVTAPGAGTRVILDWSAS